VPRTVGWPGLAGLPAFGGPLATALAARDGTGEGVGARPVLTCFRERAAESAGGEGEGAGACRVVCAFEYRSSGCVSQSGVYMHNRRSISNGVRTLLPRWLCVSRAVRGLNRCQTPRYKQANRVQAETITADPGPTHSQNGQSRGPQGRGKPRCCEP